MWVNAKDRKPPIGFDCLIVASGVTQKIAYRRVGIGFACAGGYEWVTALNIGADALQDEDVNFWQYLQDPPGKPKPLSLMLEELRPGVQARNYPAWGTINKPVSQDKRIDPAMTQDEDKDVCENCGSTEDLRVANGDDVLLCRKCRDLFHIRRGQNATTSVGEGEKQ
jgi:hypothetical protein